MSRTNQPVPSTLASSSSSPSPLSSSSASSSMSSSVSPSPSPSVSWSAASLAGLTLDSFSFDSFDPTGAPPHPEANPSGLRTEAEINAYALPEQLTETGRLLALLQSPHPVQRRSAATQLVGVLEAESSSASSAASVRQLLDGVLRMMRDLHEHEQGEVSDALIKCVNRGFVSQEVCMEVLLPTLLLYLSPSDVASSNSSVASPSPTSASSASSPSSSAFSPTTAGSTLPGPQLTPCLNLLRHLLAAHSAHTPLLSTLSSFAEQSADSIHASSRLVAAELIGLLAPHLSAQSAASLLPSFLPLCQDTSLDVRAAMSCSVCRLADAVRSSPPSLQSIVGELSELLRDEEFAVKQAALLSSVGVLPLLSASLLSSSLLPVFRSYLSSPSRPLHSTVARVLGEWCVSCSSSLLSDVRVVREFYRSSSISGDNDVRYWCVYNMPALVSLLASPSGVPSLSSSSPALFDAAFLSPLITSFSHDPHPPVRVSLSCSLPVVAPMLLRLSPQHMRLIKDVMVTLLKDADAAVRANVLSCIPIVLSASSSTTATSPSQHSASPTHASKLSTSAAASPGCVDSAVLTELFRAMLAVDLASLSYRHRMLLLESLYALRPHFTTHDMQYLYYDRLTPLLFAALHAAPPLPLLQLLLAFLTHFLSSLPSAQRRHDLLLRLLRLYSPTSRSCYDRIVFVRLVDEMSRCFSRRWMRKNATPHTAKLMQTETVREVKLRLLAVMGSRTGMRCMDGKEREQFVKWVQAIAADGDRHTAERAMEFNQRRGFDRGDKGVTAEERAADDEDDRRDREREEREDRLLREEEELMEAMMRKEQVRERNVLLSSSGGSQANNAVMLMMLKQRKEREKEHKVASKERDDKSAAATASSSSSSSFTQLAPVTPQHGKAAAAGKTSASSVGVARTGRVRGGSDKGVSSSSVVEEKERDSASKRDDRDEDERKERGRPRGYFPGLSPASASPPSASATAALLPPASSSSSPSSSPTTLLSSAAQRSASPSSNSASSATPPLPVNKQRAVPLLPSPGMHPMSRRYPPASTPSASSASAALPSPTSSSSSSSSSSSFIPQLSHSASPRLVKLSGTSGTKQTKLASQGSAIAGGGSSSSRRI